jgi:hypothetical protein
LIRRHRALRSLDVQTSSITHPLALTVGFVALVVLSRNFVTSGWAGILKFWCASTGVYVAVQMKSVAAIGTFSYRIPALRLQSPLPTSETLSAPFTTFNLLTISFRPGILEYANKFCEFVYRCQTLVPVADIGRDLVDARSLIQQAR